MNKIIIFLLFAFNIVHARNIPLKKLNIGDKVPEIYFNKVLNYKSPTAKLSDFKGKLVILDFWATWCTACISAFPHMSALQKEFKDDLQVLLVNPHKGKTETVKSMTDVISKYKIRTGFELELPVPVFDTVLNEYFPHTSIPSQVWIDKDGIVVGITYAREVTRENIIKIISGKNPNMGVRDDFGIGSKQVLGGFEYAKPILGINTGNYMYSNVLTGYNKDLGYSNGYKFNKDRQLVGYFQPNLTLGSLLTIGFSKEFNNATPYARESGLVIDIKDKRLDKNKFYNGSDTSNLFCYELSFLPNAYNLQDCQNILREDLTRIFKIKIDYEDRQTRSLIFRSTKKLLSSKSKFTYKREEGDLRQETLRKFLHMTNVEGVFDGLQQFLGAPLFDETNFKGTFDIDFPYNFDLKDQAGIILVLKEIGFEIIEEVRNVKVLVITENKEIIN